MKPKFRQVKGDIEATDYVVPVAFWNNKKPDSYAHKVYNTLLENYSYNMDNLGKPQTVGELNRDGVPTFYLRWWMHGRGVTVWRQI